LSHNSRQPLLLLRGTVLVPKSASTLLMTVSRYLLSSRVVGSGRAATGASREAGEAEPRPRGRDVIAEFGHADAVTAHHQMHHRIGEKIDKDRLLTRLEPLSRDMREIRAPLLAHNSTPKKYFIILNPKFSCQIGK
jgi:hypothetical protein